MISEAFQDASIGGFIENGLAAQNPGQLAVRITHDAPLIVGIEINDEVRNTQGPDELHAPLSIGFLVMDPGHAVPLLQRCIETATAEKVDVIHAAIGTERVTIQRADLAFLQ